MALQKVVVPFKYQGMQTRLDSKTAPLGSFEVIENRDMTQFHKLEQRPAQKFVAQNFEFSDDLVGVFSVNREVGAITDTKLYTYSPTEDTMIEKGELAQPVIGSLPVLSNTYSQTQIDSTLSDTGQLGVVWVDSVDDGVYFMVKDSATGAIIVNQTLIAETTNHPPRILYANNKFYIFYTITSAFGDIYILIYNMLTSELSTPFLFVQTGNPAPQIYDVILLNNNNIFCVTYVGTVLFAEYWNTTTDSNGSPINGLPASEYLADYSLSVSGYSTSNKIPLSMSLASIDDTYVSINFFAFLRSSGSPSTTGAYYLFTNTYDLNMNLVAAGTPCEFQVTTLESPDDVICGQLTTVHVPNYTNPDIFSGLPSNVVMVFASCFREHETSSIPTDTDTDVRTFAIINVDTVPSYTDLSAVLYGPRPNLLLLSTCFTLNDRAYAIVNYVPHENSDSYGDPIFQRTYFIIRDDFSVVARLYTKLGTTFERTTNYLSRVNQYQDNVNFFSVCLPRTSWSVLDDNEQFSNSSIYSTQIVFFDQQIPTISVENNLYLTGGYLKVYDGYSGIVEHGFHLYPEIYSIGKTSKDGTTSFPAGSYSFVCVWEWTDNTGQIYRSEPSTAVTYVSTGTTSSWPVVYVRSLPVTNKNSQFGRSDVVLAVYRTLVNGTTYYRSNSLPASWVFNDVTEAFISYTENQLDSEISDHPLLYTTGGVFANTAIPAPNLMALGKNRLFLGRGDMFPLRIYCSKEKEQGLGFEFSEDLYVDVDPLGGYPTALAAMDDKVIIFKQATIYFISGQGPDKLGNGYFTIPQLIASDVGCVRPQSVVLTDQGLMFKSLKGIYLLSRSLETVYIGAPIEAYNDLTITSAVAQSAENKVKFTTSEGTTLVYDTFYKDWKIYTNQQVVGSVMSNSLWYSANSEYNKVTVETTTQNYDFDGRTIQGRYVTNWISLPGTQGYQRIYAIRIVGDGQSLQHTLNCKLYYDYQEFSSQQVSITPSDEVGPAYGEDSPYGSGTPYGSSNTGNYIYEIRPRIQKCTAIKIEIWDEFPEGSGTASFSLSEIVIVGGAKYGPQRISPNRRLT